MKLIDRAFHRLARKMKHRKQEHRLPDGRWKPRQEGQSLTDSETRQPRASDKVKEQSPTGSETRQPLASDKAKEQSLDDSETRQPLASDKAKEQSLADSETRKRLAEDKARQQESCALLQLPLESILDIADNLPRSIFGDDNPVTRPQQHLQRFLAPHHRTVRHFEGSLNVQLSVYPRIVGNRFLLLSEWRIETEAHKVCTTKGIHGHILICRHQEYSQDAWLLPPDEVPEAGALCEAFGQLASQPPDFEAHGACASCTTDFSVQGTRNRCHIRSWQDLGPEGAVTHFRALLAGGSAISHHEPGSVRQLHFAKWSSVALVAALVWL
ncbi:hypothetical protein HRG_008129 [Hirsutella rhossiliensis]|uniref:Uncharacterized protein n=1 Tax=Hirsutella rhossiliensis TaxID=111463 RepID=A0A9P8SFP7_9HYPO|nr:uncharacterized protein HRG_08129 [Hirsutella rhossiliensis]KAH0960976.1 hypothetical protein HRG_08129 [Hirsutella rhossiliensis]